MAGAAPGIVAIECIGISLYLIPFLIALRWLIWKWNELRATRRIFYSLMVMFCIVREIHISLNFSRAEGAPPFDEKKYVVRNNNMIMWTAILGVYFLYSAFLVMVYEWASLLAKANMESHKRLNIIIIVVATTFNLQYWALLITHVETPHSMEAAAYATIGCASILTLIPAIFYYCKISNTLKESKSHDSERHSILLKKLAFVIVPISFSLVFRSAIAWAVAIKGSSSFVSFYVWITLFWMIPELIPVTIMLIVISPNSKDKKKPVAMPDVRTPSTLHLQETTENSKVKTSSSGDSSSGILV